MRSERTPAGAIGWVWRGSATTGGCVVEVLGPGRSRFWTDLTDPGAVVAFEAMDDLALRGLARLFGRAWYDRISADAPGASDDDRWAPCPLDEAWRRVALVESVDQWWPWPIDVDLLTIDRALALREAGARGLAAVTIATCTGRVVELRAAGLGGALSPAAADIVASAAELTIDSLVDDAPDRLALLALADTVSYEATASDYAALDAVLDADGSTVALTMGPLANLDAAVDLACVSPRVLRWEGPDVPEIRADADVDAGVIQVAVSLASDADAESTEAEALIAYLADAASGEIVERGAVQLTEPVDVDAVELSVVLSLGDRSPEDVLVGIYQAGIGTPPRPSLVGRSLARLDRLLVATWAEARRHQATGALAPDRSAQVQDALTRLDAAAAFSAAGAEVDAAQFGRLQASRLGALAQLRPDLSPADQAQRPLLVELLR